MKNSFLSRKLATQHRAANFLSTQQILVGRDFFPFSVIIAENPRNPFIQFMVRGH